MSDGTRARAVQIYRAALRAADASDAVKRHLELGHGVLCVGEHVLPLAADARIVVVGAGKAGGRMALAVEDTLGPRVSGGFVSVKEGHVAPTTRIEVKEASHPLPDERSLANGRAILGRVAGLSEADVVLCLLSGGGSALMEALGEGLSLAHLRALTRELMHAGANIVELNTVRKHVSQIKGGQLARHASPAALGSLILSDVVGDDLSSIASGPTAPDTTTFADALAVFEKFGLHHMHSGAARKAGASGQDSPLSDIVDYLARGVRGELEETPKPGDPLFARVRHVIVGNNTLALDAMAREARTLGYAASLVDTQLQGEARGVGREIARFARAQARTEHHVCLLWGGETTVSVRGAGRGGRNHELALAAARELDGDRRITLLSAATDGGDGSSSAAGVIVDGATLPRALRRGLDAEAALFNNDSDPFFSALGDQLITGPTFTNVNDVVLALIE